MTDEEQQALEEFSRFGVQVLAAIRANKWTGTIPCKLHALEGRLICGEYTPPTVKIQIAVKRETVRTI